MWKFDVVNGRNREEDVLIIGNLLPQNHHQHQNMIMWKERVDVW